MASCYRHSLFAPLSSVIRDFHQDSAKSASGIEIEERCNYWIKDQGIESCS